MTVGARKFALGTVVECQLFAVAMWAPGVSEVSRNTAVEAMIAVLVATVGGIGWENYVKAKHGNGGQA